MDWYDVHSPINATIFMAIGVVLLASLWLNFWITRGFKKDVQDGKLKKAEELEKARVAHILGISVEELERSSRDHSLSTKKDS